MKKSHILFPIIGILKQKVYYKKIFYDYYVKIMFAKSFVLALLAASANAVSLETEGIYDYCGCQLP